MLALMLFSAFLAPHSSFRITHPTGLEVTTNLPGFSEADSTQAYACLVPAPDGHLPRIEERGARGEGRGVRVSLGKVAIAGGVSVVPLVFERTTKGTTGEEVTVRLVYQGAGGRGFLSSNPSRMGIRSHRGGARGEGRGSRVGALELELVPPTEGRGPANLMGEMIQAAWETPNPRTQVPTGYLIITPDEFYENVLPLAAWKERKGFTVWVKKLSEAGGTKEQIRTYIQTAYKTFTPCPSYVLLVGAITKIPAFYTAGTPCVTDHNYACVDGDDYLADLFVGRLPAANPSELNTMVAKILGYEMTPYVADTTWYRRALAVGTSYAEGGTPAVTALVTKRVIRERLLGYGFVQVDTVFYPPTASGRGPVDAAVNRGVLFVNGRGWGNRDGWRYPSFLINDVAGLANNWKLPVVTSLYCGTGNFEANPCFGEMWLRAGTPQSPKGGVAFWGSSYTATSTRWNNCMDYGIYQAILDYGMNTCGPAMYAGKLAQLANFPLPGDSQDLGRYFHVYNLLGDPGLAMWTGVPHSPVVTYPTTIAVGASSFEVTVRDGSGAPVRKALVCLLKPNDVHSVGVTDASGRVRLAISTASADTMQVTVTGRNLIPHLGKCAVVAQEVFVGRLSHDPFRVGPGASPALSVTLKNFGTSRTATGIFATLRSLDSAAGVTDSVKACADIAPGGTALAGGFGLAVAPACSSGQVLPLELAVRSGESLWLSAFELVVTGPTLKAGRYRVHDANGILDPGESAELSVLVRNSGDGAANGVSGVLRSLNPSAVQVLDSMGTYGSIGTNDSAENTQDRFSLRASPGIGAGRKFSLRLVLRSGDCEQQWDFPVTVGPVSASAPLGPDRHGYYAYDDTDFGYSERPSFDWLEINPGLGGQGARVPLSNDVSVPIALPFAFRFYGREYNTISVCDNGYVAMGNQWLGEAYNWSIPSPMGPDGLVAAFWDDFRADTLGAGVYTFHDAANRRFIVEWSRCIHVHGYRSPILADTQSFQMALYDPAHHSTPTGDGPILVQYLKVCNDDSITVEDGHNYATVGIASPDHTDGLEYTFANRYPLPAASIEPGRAIRFTTVPPDTFAAVSERRGTGDGGRGMGFSVFPNPARTSVKIQLSEPTALVRVFDVAGREVRRLPAQGRGAVEWDLLDERGHRVPAGAYLLIVHRSPAVELSGPRLLKPEPLNPRTPEPTPPRSTRLLVLAN